MKLAFLSGFHHKAGAVPGLPLAGAFRLDIVPADAVALTGAKTGFDQDRLHQVLVLQPDFTDQAPVPHGLKLPVHKEGHQAGPSPALVATARIVDVKMQRW